MNYKNINDYELLYYVKENDDNALNTLFNKYEPVINKLASKYYNKYKYIGITYDDLVQEARIGLMNSIKSFDDEQSLFYSFTVLCIERQLINYTKAHNRLKNYPLNSSNVFSSKRIEYVEDSNIDDILLENEKYFECKNYLKFNLSIVYELRYNGFSFKDISKLLDIPRSTVDGRISLIRKYLHNNLKVKF